MQTTFHKIHTVTHKQHEVDYWAGFEAVAKEVREMGFKAARDKFNMDNPTASNPKSLGAYYYAKGGMSALQESL